jgi:hypothetical protein
MVLWDLFEHSVSVTKTIWRKRGSDISQHAVSRLVATELQPRTTIDVKVLPDAS